MTTGDEIRRIFAQQIGQTYTGIEDLPKQNRRFRKAMINAIEAKYRVLDEEREFDELKNVLRTDVVINPVNSEINMLSNNIEHVMSCSVTYRKPVDGVILKSASNTTPIQLEFLLPNSIRQGERLYIQGIQGNLNANGISYSRILNSKKISLYSDRYFTQPKAGSGDYLKSTQVRMFREVVNVCNYLRSDAKNSAWMVADETNPMYAVADGVIKLYPKLTQGGAAQSAVVDFVRSDITFFDLANATFDYETVYSKKFIYYVISFAAKDFSDSFRDYNAGKTISNDILINP